jgi:hypothetical protein
MGAINDTSPEIIIYPDALNSKTCHHNLFNQWWLVGRCKTVIFSYSAQYNLLLLLLIIYQFLIQNSRLISNFRVTLQAN